MEAVLLEEDGSSQQINYIILICIPMLSLKLRREKKTLSNENKHKKDFLKLSKGPN